MNFAETTVLKFGSSVLGSESDLPEAVHEIYRHIRRNQRVIAVVSALGSTTDDLLHRATQWCDDTEGSDPDALALLLGTGETVSAALLKLALRRAGIPATVLDPWRADLRTIGPPLDASPYSIQPRPFHDALQTSSVVIVPGFFGLDHKTGAPALLGRGGSDLTATFIGAQLGCSEVVLLKDVDGIYTSDPAEPDRQPLRYNTLAFDDAIALESGVVQTAALCCARDYRIPIQVRAVGDSLGTRVGPGQTRIATHDTTHPPFRVAILGCGTVGQGVVDHLNQQQGIEIASVLVRDPASPRDCAIDPATITCDIGDVFATRPDLVVELIGGHHDASSYIAGALERGISVVTANKAVIASDGERLRNVAICNGVMLRYAAAVGGGVPMIEHVDARSSEASLVGIEGVLNGTSTVVLDRLAQGDALDDAIAFAQVRGYAEADCSRDLDGHDAADKLAILIRHAFGHRVNPESIIRTPVTTHTADLARLALSSGRCLRQVASCVWDNGNCRTEITLRELPTTDPCVGSGPWCGLRLTDTTGATSIVQGSGAGRWPTAESVLGDILELQRKVAAASVERQSAEVAR